MEHTATNIETLLWALESNHPGPASHDSFGPDGMTETERGIYKEQKFRDFGPVIQMDNNGHR